MGKLVFGYQNTISDTNLPIQSLMKARGLKKEIKIEGFL